MIEIKRNVSQQLLPETAITVARTGKKESKAVSLHAEAP